MKTYDISFTESPFDINVWAQCGRNILLEINQFIDLGTFEFVRGIEYYFYNKILTLAIVWDRGKCAVLKCDVCIGCSLYIRIGPWFAYSVFRLYLRREKDPRWVDFSTKTTNLCVHPTKLWNEDYMGQWARQRHIWIGEFYEKKMYVSPAMKLWNAINE
jgi:hypothetical protein